MANEISRVDAVVTVIHSGRHLLLDYNNNWGAFTLPVTKLRRRPPGPAPRPWELGSEAAMRNVAECLGITSVQPPRLLTDLGEMKQSDRDGEIKYYAFQVYGFPVDRQQVRPVGLATWLTPDEILEPGRQRLSPTALSLVAGLQEAALVRQTEFPPPDSPPRGASSSIAVIARGHRGEKSWLCQWNERWGRYFLAGGHQEGNESPQECMVRELKEELDLDPGEYACQPRALLEYPEWSTSRWQMTDYRHSMFDGQLQAAGAKKLGGNPARLDNPANRWLTADEIRSERCLDDKLVSPTARIILTKLGDL